MMTATELTCVPETQSDWIQTFSGVAFPIFDPKPEHIKLEDIAHALSNQCRFGGHCRTLYSVAQHSVLVLEILGEMLGFQHMDGELTLLRWSDIKQCCCHAIRGEWWSRLDGGITGLLRAGLLHDAAEAYLVDVPTPIKRNLPAYSQIEHKVMGVICERFGVDPVLAEDLSVKGADKIALATEYRDLIVCHDHPWACLAGFPPSKIVIRPQRPDEAETAFLRTAASLGLK